jgi:uncharacterized membrane protein YesL
MNSSAFDVILMPVLWGTFWGIVAGMAILGVMNAVEALFVWLRRMAQSIQAVRRAARATPRRTYRPVVRSGLSRSVHG